MATATAVLSAAMSGEDAAKNIHPFFKPNGVHEQRVSHDHPHTTHRDVQPLTAASSEVEAAQGKPPKGKKGPVPNGAAEPGSRGKTQKTLRDIVHPAPTVHHPLDSSVSVEADGLVSSDPVGNAPRRKRRRTGQYESVEVGGPDEVAGSADLTRETSPHVLVPTSSPLPETAPSAADQAELGCDDVPKTPPKKMLRLSGNGKFSSPISKKSKNDDNQPSPNAVKKRGRPRKAKPNETPKQLVVRIRYTAEVGHRIEQILAGEERIHIAAGKKDSPKKPRTPRKPAKATHPFFLGKPNDPPPAPKRESPRKASATTPGKLRTQVLLDRLPEVRDVPYPVGSALLKDRLMVKHPGAREPPWPDREQSHVRGLDEAEEGSTASSALEPPAFGKSKRKNARLPFPHEESVLRHFASHLVPEADSRLRPDGFHEPHACLRLPEKLLISGYDIRQRTASQLSVSLSEADADDLSLPAASQPKVHPALRTLWTALPDHMTAFDEGKGGTLSWTQKYAPKAAKEVLQPAREMTVLRDWLMSLTVTAVETASRTHVKPAVRSEPKPKKKRRRKPDYLDDFLVDSDDEIHNIDELRDPEEVSSSTAAKAQRSVIQMASAGVKLNNAILLSGPYGCGKTAAALAVAKELGFKVFEISPCERRSGKDVLDRVGDMTENHLVKHHGVDAGELSSTEEPIKARLDEAFQRDLQSGRQGKMNAFFQPQAKSAKAPTQQKKATKTKTLEAVEKALRKPAKDQQQSLILLEEVDVLFKDDKDFWTTVLKLIATSKRPFIMTCNDEDMVPLQAMALHAILRFTPPTVDLAVDYMLLVAASEGHLLQRETVTSLYYAKDGDLRASIAELDFRCQMGVGDPRGGLTWIYQRWPPGVDVDGLGRRLRVVSQGTYHSGIGLLPDSALTEEEKMRWAWREFGASPTHMLGWDDCATLFRSESQEERRGSNHRLNDLKSFAKFADTLSAIDAFTSIGLPETAPLDTTQPEFSDKARHQYIEGLPLLQTDEQTDYPDTTAELAVACTLAAWRACHEGNSVALGAGEMQGRFTSPHHEESDHQRPLSRHAFAVFDPISTASDSALAPSGLSQSSFDGPLSIIATDLAPYVRSIVHYDLALEEQRDRLNDLLMNGDARGGAKKARTTRAARSALEGSQRASTRRERWFTKALDLDGVLATGGRHWLRMSAVVAGENGGSEVGEEAPLSSAETAQMR